MRAGSVFGAPTRRLALTVLAAAVLAACAPAQRQAPGQAEVVVPDGWRDGAAGVLPVAASWWRGFGDATLDALVDAALARNTDVLLAAARVEEAQALLQAAQAARLPAVDVVIGAQAGRAPGAAGVSTTRVVQPELQARWEIDLWGRLRQQERASALQYRATQAERAGVALGVAAATVQSYLGLLALDAQLAITLATADSRAKALRLASDQAQLGYTSQLQLTQAQAEHAASSSSGTAASTAAVRVARTPARYRRGRIAAGGERRHPRLAPRRLPAASGAQRQPRQPHGQW
jgi:multidrug efflux system outer membrane protein